MARQRSNTPRRVKEWAGLPQASNAFTSSTTAIIGDLAFTEPSTVLRMIFEYGLFSTAAPVALDAAHLSFGIAVVSTDAAAVGGTALPDPRTEPEFPWLFWAEHQLTKQVAARESGGDPMMALRRSYDIKTMRKVRPQEVVTQVFQYANQNGNPGVQIAWGQTRVLIAT